MPHLKEIEWTHSQTDGRTSGHQYAHIFFKVWDIKRDLIFQIILQLVGKDILYSVSKMKMYTVIRINYK